MRESLSSFSTQVDVAGASTVGSGSELTSGSAINVFMADDDSGFLRAYKKFFEKVPDLNLAGVASTGEGLAEHLSELRPDVLLLDVEMPGPSGIEIVRDLRKRSLPVKIVILTAFDHDEYVHGALRLGASGFLLKNASPAQILSAVRSVHAGHASLALDVTSRLADYFPVRKDAAPSGALGEYPPFTEQQVNICRLLAAGYKSQEIADELHLSNETVRTYLRRMFEKFGAKNRTHLVVLAYKAGVIH